MRTLLALGALAHTIAGTRLLAALMEDILTDVEVPVLCKDENGQMFNPAIFPDVECVDESNASDTTNDLA